ncbi:ABC transporter permease [Gluconobacter wancherniae]|nr:ABC transporter permease [Gluconobacter wancherniae]MBF0854032.1 ABC transporter permease [Gluconobacter wancherniae]MBS1088854.1 ABC transporter permease [Gluconobacter wancherniae]MBS1095526.1 ABC transporter permease [Gluconobacter wancherniae]GBD57088.1 sugar ABC transporter permease [Gluconobacter wancherniae NBRC 103581]GBR65152.1 polysaccharide/O-antigen exporter permease [Gluconobacter wancherniae NBRC 103581]
MADNLSHSPVLEFAPQRGIGRVTAAWADLRAGLKLFPLAFALGWLDIKMRYRGSMLGPFWLTLSTAVMVAALGVIYSKLFHMDLPRYLPFLSLSIVLWGFISTIAIDAATVFTQSASQFHSMRTPASLPVLRVIVRNVLTLLHNAVVIVAVFAIFHVWPHQSWSLLVSLPLWIADSFAGVLLIGMLGARFRDIPPIIVSVLQVFFFVTPVIWKPDLIYLGRQYLLLDPFYPILEIVRAPLLGGSVRPSIWFAAITQAFVLWGIAAVFFCRMRARITYWI